MQQKIYLMDALPGFFNIKNLPQGFERFLSSRVFPLALFGEAMVVVHEECRSFLEPYYPFFPELQKSLVYIAGEERSLTARVFAGKHAQYFPNGAEIYTTYPGEDLLPLARQCDGDLAGYNPVYPLSQSLDKGIFYPIWGEDIRPLAAAARKYGLQIPDGYLVRHRDATNAKEAFSEVCSRHGKVVVKPVTETGNGDGVVVNATMEDFLRLIDLGDALVTEVVDVASVYTPTGYLTEFSLSLRGVNGYVSTPSIQITRDSSWVGCFVPPRFEDVGIPHELLLKVQSQIQWILNTLKLKLVCGFDVLVDQRGGFSIVDFNFRLPGSHVPIVVGKKQIAASKPLTYEPFTFFDETLSNRLEALSREGLLLQSDGSGILLLDLPCGYRKAYVAGDRAMSYWKSQYAAAIHV